MKRIFACVCAAGLLMVSAPAQSPVTVTIGPAPKEPAAPIPSDFLGLSFGSKTLLPNADGSHFFTPRNTTLITLFQNLGIKHLRVGGTSVESPTRLPIPDRTDIDSLFGFVRAAGVAKVIYSLRLLETSPELHYADTNAALAQYLWKNYRPYLDCLAIGNEPDRKQIYAQDYTITNFSSYLTKWRAFAAAISRAVPEVKFAGPDAGSGNVEWTTQFTEAEKNSGRIGVITEHFYAGGGGRGKSARDTIEAMLSPRWIERNETLYNKVAVLVFSNTFPLRFTEANDHFTGGVPDASNTFAGALWALDFLHWWAAHGAQGVNFHNTQWVVNDVITPDENGQLRINPKGYAFRAFALGSQGHCRSVGITNPDGLNLTAYAVGNEKELFVTLINKEHGPGARELKTTLVAPGIGRRAAVIYMTAPNGDVTAQAEVTLGGASMSGNALWRGEWKPLTPGKDGQWIVPAPVASAAIVKLEF